MIHIFHTSADYNHVVSHCSLHG